MVDLSFGQVEAVLAHVNGIADHKRVAFAGRLKFLQKNGVPARATPGRGKAGAYSIDHLLQLGLAVELLQCGLSPQRAAEIVRDVWIMKADEVFSVLTAVDQKFREPLSPAEEFSHELENAKFPWVWSLKLAELYDLTDKTPTRGMYYMSALPTRHLDSLARVWGTSDERRVTIINAYGLINSIVMTAALKFSFIKVEDAIEQMTSHEPNLRISAELFDLQIASDSDVVDPQTPDQRSWLNDVKSRLRKGILPTEIGERRSFVRAIRNTLSKDAVAILAYASWGTFSPRRHLNEGSVEDLDQLISFHLIEIDRDSDGGVKDVRATGLGDAILDQNLFLECFNVDPQA